MDEILAFLQDIHSKTKWPFFELNAIEARFGPETKKHLNELREQKKVRRREGCNRSLIELITFKDEKTD